MKILIAAPENRPELLIATPHIAGSTDDSMRGIVAGVAENIRRIERGEEPLNAQ